MTRDKINIHQHGVAVDQKKSKVKCNYCGKVVSGFSRLKHHLGGIRGDVTPCLETPILVKEALEAEILGKKNGNLIKEVGQLQHPNLPLKRNWCPRDGEPNKTSESVNKKHNGVNSKVAGTFVVDSSSQEISKSIGRYFYEAGIDFDAIRSPSFQRMVKATLSPGKTIKFPSCQELKGWILQDAVKEMQQYVTEIRNSWASTGCSILLDGWVDSNDRNLINILVYCPRSTIYLRSSDISSFNGNVDAMLLFFEEVLEEVGVENVVQIVAYSTSACMMEAGKKLMEKHKTVFWTVDASHCMELMLQKFTNMDRLIQLALEKAKALTQFIYSHATVLKLLRDACPDELVKSSKIRSIVPFLTLENIVSQKECLIRMFQSSDWHSSILASTGEGKRMSEMVENQSFWTECLLALKATIPLVEVIKLLNGTNKPQVGFIYDTLDQAKETIKKEFKHSKSYYAKFWTAIDDIWDKYLHSHLHAAGYFLNPTLFYSSDFYTDVEVSCGLCCCVVRMTEDRHIQDLITQQIDEYRMGRGTFHFGSFKDKLSNISPALWWSQYGVQFPELQRLAIRILSQTCNGASHYRLKRSLVETLLTEGMNGIEKQRLQDLVFVHCNLQLQAFDPEGKNGIAGDVLDSMDEWIIGKGPNLVSENTQLTWMDLELASRNGKEKVCVERAVIYVKEEAEEEEEEERGR